MSGLVFGGRVIELGITPVFWLEMVVVAVIGAGSTGFHSLSNTIGLNMTERSHQGRVQSLLMLSWAGFGMAAAPLGLLAELIGLRAAIVLMGVVATAGVLAYSWLENEDRFPRTADEAEKPAPAPVAGD